MAFRVRQQTRPNSVGRDPTIWIVEDGAGGCLEVWPALGFNAYRWKCDKHELLYRDPEFFDELKPSRSGWPILFPFPNRIRDGRFTWGDTAYQWPLNDPAGKNAIHGIAGGRPWRVVDHGAEHNAAWLTGEFRPTRDAGEASNLWPGKLSIRVTYRLGQNRLRVESTVENLGSTSAPFGLGYHPYFCVAPFGADAALVDLEANRQWKLVECLPTGSTSPFGWHEQPFAGLNLDSLLTDVPMCRPEVRECAALQSPEGPRLVVEASRDFRELVVFTPPHREAICFEPYTCTTDAINLQQQGVDAGLIVLQPDASWHGWVQVTLLQEPAPAA